MNRLRMLGFKVWWLINELFRFDPTWYLKNYPDVASYKLGSRAHFIVWGIREYRIGNANTPWNSRRLAINDSRRHGRSIGQLDLPRPDHFRELHIFFNVASNGISGGMLSISRFAGLLKTQCLDTPEIGVLMSTVPVSADCIPYQLFNSPLEPIHFDEIVLRSNPKCVNLFVPEHYVVNFVSELTSNHRRWLAARRVKVIVLNQNNDLMPEAQVLHEALLPISVEVVIATAHETYSTQEVADRFGYPIKRLTPLLPKILKRDFQDKSRLIMVSPDVPAGPDGEAVRDWFIAQLEDRLDGVSVVIVENLNVDEYLDLAGSAKIAVTFGEGLDGYFIETVMSGGVAFALRNDTFMPDEVLNLPFVSGNVPELLERVVDSWSEFESNPESYMYAAENLSKVIDNLYSEGKTLNDLRSLIQGEFDFHPKPRLRGEYPFRNIEDFLRTEHGFKFINSEHGFPLAVTPMGEVVEHFGGESLSVFYEVYFSKDYDELLRLPDSTQQAVLLDIGANVGLASIYLANRNPKIKAIYAYEPIPRVADVAIRNIKTNFVDDESIFTVKKLALSDRFETTRLEFIPNWSTAFSVDDQTIAKQISRDPAGEQFESHFVEVEIIPAHFEVQRIISTHPGTPLIMKCDAQGSEFQIISDLKDAGLLEAFELIVLESHFKNPQPIVSRLESSGFEVSLRLDSVLNTVYKIVARKIHL